MKELAKLGALATNVREMDIKVNPGDQVAIYDWGIECFLAATNGFKMLTKISTVFPVHPMNLDPLNPETYEAENTWLEPQNVAENGISGSARKLSWIMLDSCL